MVKVQASTMQELQARGIHGLVRQRLWEELAQEFLRGEIGEEEMYEKLLARRRGDARLAQVVAKIRGGRDRDGETAQQQKRFFTVKKKTATAAVTATETKGTKGTTLLEQVAQALATIDAQQKRIAELEEQIRELAAGGSVTRYTGSDDPWHVSTDYVPTRQAIMLRKLLQQGKHILAVGPAGCGKTEAVRWACREEKRPMVLVSMHAHVMADALEGYSTLVVRDGVTTQEWCAGALQRAMESGAVFVVDEFDRAPVAIQHMLNDVAQSKTLTLREGEYAGKRIEAKPGFLVVATANTLNGSTGEYASTSVDRSTLSRFRVLQFTYDEDAERRLCEAKVGKDTAKRVMAAFAKARKLYSDGEVETTLGTRHLAHMLQDLADGWSLTEAWSMSCASMCGEDGSPGYRRMMQILDGIKGTEEVA